MAVSWIYRLTKDQLILELEKYELDTSGSLAVLRQRLVSFARQHPDIFTEKPRDPPDYKEDPDRTNDVEQMEAELNDLKEILVASSTRREVIAVNPEEEQAQGSPMGSTPEQHIPPPGRYANHPPSTSRQTMAHDDMLPHQSRQSTGHTLDQMRKWSCHFDGRGVYEFLERVRELQKAYQLSDEQLLRGFPELLRGDAQLWYRNCASAITTWGELEQGLRDFYLSPGERRHRDQQMSERRQGSNESIRGYATSQLTLMRRRGGFNHERILEALYHNVKPGLRLLIRPREATTPEELIQRVQDIEEVQAQLPREGPTENRAGGKFSRPAHPLQAAFVREECCWKCGQRGHNRFNCRNPPKRFCSWCGKEDILTRECQCPRTGNEKRTGPTRPAPRSERPAVPTQGPSSK